MVFGLLGLQPFLGAYIAWDTLHVIGLAISLMMSSMSFFVAYLYFTAPFLSLTPEAVIVPTIFGKAPDRTVPLREIHSIRAEGTGPTFLCLPGRTIALPTHCLSRKEKQRFLARLQERRAAAAP